jgi:hypothetical protein
VADGVRRVCWRWQEVVPVTAEVPGWSGRPERVEVVATRLRFSCVCGGDGCPDDPRLGLLERARLMMRVGVDEVRRRG